MTRTGAVRLTPLMVAVTAVIAYSVVIGGSTLGETDLLIRAINAAIATVLITIYLLRAPGNADSVDRGVLLALIMFCLACSLSLFPRQSFDAALGALTYAAGLFVARGVLSHFGPRNVALFTLMVLSASMTLLTAARWFPLFADWWTSTGGDVLPPLNLNLHATPWGHRYDLALLVVMLYPSWWVRRPTAARAAAATVVGAIAVVIVIADGSRTLWLAIAVGIAAIGMTKVRPLLGWWRQNRKVGVAVVAAAVAFAIVTGFASSLVDRLLNPHTLLARAEMWSAAVELWLKHPLAGIGPGTFPWALQQTPYFETNSWAPRHPDNLLFQLLPEAGIFGVTAVVAVCAVVVVPILKRSPRPAQFALVTFGVASVGANPTDFGFLVVVAVVWLGIALPRMTTPDHQQPSQARIRLSFVASAVIAMAFLSTLGGAMAYGVARQAIHEGQISSARTALDTAMVLDPMMALYVRQRGTLSLVENDAATAARDLRRATDLNPSDDLAWRSLALARRGLGDHVGAFEAIQEALRLQRSDPTNLLLLARMEAESGDVQASGDVLAEVVQAWPTVVWAPGWDKLLPAGWSTSEVVQSAIERWGSKQPAVVPYSDQALLLVSIANRQDLLNDALQASRLAPGLAEAAIAVYSCRTDADDRLSALPTSDHQDAEYWALVAAREPDGPLKQQAMRAYEIMTGGTLSEERTTETLNPLDENTARGFSLDVWGYRRLPIAWPTIGEDLPSPSAGRLRSIILGVGAVLEGC